MTPGSICPHSAPRGRDPPRPPLRPIRFPSQGGNCGLQSRAGARRGGTRVRVFGRAVRSPPGHRRGPPREGRLPGSGRPTQADGATVSAPRADRAPGPRAPGPHPYAMWAPAPGLTSSRVPGAAPRPGPLPARPPAPLPAPWLLAAPPAGGGGAAGPRRKDGTNSAAWTLSCRLKAALRFSR